jgi:hypothetical protein
MNRQRLIHELKQYIEILEREKDPFERFRGLGEPEEALNLGVLWWDGAESEVVSFVEAREYADDYLDTDPDDVEPYHVIIIPARKDEL